MANILWMGWNPEVRALSTELEFEGHTIHTAEDAPESLEMLSTGTYDIILQQNPMPVGNLQLDEGTRLDDWVATGIMVTRRVREIAPETPLVLVHSDFFPRYTAGLAIHGYRDAGITDHISWTGGKSNREFAQGIERHL